MNEDELIPGAAEALSEMQAGLEDEPEPIVTDPGDEQPEEEAVPEPDLAAQLYEKLKADAQSAYEAQQAAEREQYAYQSLEEMYPDGVPVEVVEQRATHRALQVIQLQETVHSEVDEVIATYEQKFGSVPVKTKNAIKSALRQIPPQNMRLGLGKEAARYFVAEALENGDYTPSAPKKTVRAVGGDSRQMAAGGARSVPIERSAEEDMVRNAFPTLTDKDIKEMLSK